MVLRQLPRRGAQQETNDRIITTHTLSSRGNEIPLPWRYNPVVSECISAKSAESDTNATRQDSYNRGQVFRFGTEVGLGLSEQISHRHKRLVLGDGAWLTTGQQNDGHRDSCQGGEWYRAIQDQTKAMVMKYGTYTSKLSGMGILSSTISFLYLVNVSVFHHLRRHLCRMILQLP